MTDITPERMSEEELTELRGFACISYVAELFAHIDALTAENETLKVYNGRLEAALADPSAIKGERDAASDACRRLRIELDATTQRLRNGALDDFYYLDQKIANLKKELEHAVAQGYRTGDGTDGRCVGGDVSRARGPGMDGQDADRGSGPEVGGEVRSGEAPHQDHAGDDLPASSGLPVIDDAARKAAMSAAVWVTASPHEWEWTKADQVAMARFCCLANRIIDGGAGLIASERERQKTGEGWTPEHDDQHANSELVKAGALIAAEIDRLQREAAARAALEGKTP